MGFVPALPRDAVGGGSGCQYCSGQDNHLPMGMGRMLKKPLWNDTCAIPGCFQGHTGADRSLKRMYTGPSLGMRSPSSLLYSNMQGPD